jgi:bacillithiol system protein YtxJ
MWTEITTPEALETILTREDGPPVMLFKHSTRCPISARALRAAEAWLADHPGLVNPCRILVVEHRPVSDLAAERLGVRHESPQALLIRGGRVIWHASHLSIHGDALDKALRQAGLTS